MELVCRTYLSGRVNLGSRRVRNVWHLYVTLEAVVYEVSVTKCFPGFSSRLRTQSASGCKKWHCSYLLPCSLSLNRVTHLSGFHIIIGRSRLEESSGHHLVQRSVESRWLSEAKWRKYLHLLYKYLLLTGRLWLHRSWAFSFLGEQTQFLQISSLNFPTFSSHCWLAAEPCVCF